MTGRPRLVLGTVQFGLDYGVTNTAGRVAEADVAAILARAAEAGIDTLDTAAAYGDSEDVIGRLAGHSFRIMTKIGGPPPRFADLTRASATRLGRTPDAILLHDARALMGQDAKEVVQSLLALREAGLAPRVGVSVYSPEQLASACSLFRPDLVQLPFSVIDRRFERTGWLARLREAGTEVHARSLFLQGALLAAATPDRLGFADATLGAFRAACAAAGMTQLEACVSAGLAAPVDGLVVGVTSLAELQAILAAASSCRPLPASFDALASDEAGLVDPSRWPLG